MNKSYSVKISGVDAGILSDFGSHSFFVLDENYLRNPVRPIFGQTFEDFPKKQRQHKVRSDPWFANLLPEGELRTLVARQVGVYDARDVPLLGAMGQDLPGAVTIEATDDLNQQHAFADVQDGEREVTDDRSGIRFSVAGVQLKFSMQQRGRGFSFAGKGELGGHLVKFASMAYPDNSLNEFAMMRWACACGLNVPPVALAPISDIDLSASFPIGDLKEAFVIERFDRNGNERIHIEDFNQVVGQWPQDKYKNYSYESLASLVYGVTDSPDDLEDYIRLVAFSVLIGNEDAHLKNFSLIYPGGLTPRLAPVYDLVSTVVYQGLTRGLALTLDRQRDLTMITPDSFRKMARRTGHGEDDIVSLVREFVAKAMDVRHEFIADMGPSQARFEAHLENLGLLGSIAVEQASIRRV